MGHSRRSLGPRSRPPQAPACSAGRTISRCASGPTAKAARSSTCDPNPAKVRATWARTSAVFGSSSKPSPTLDTTRLNPRSGSNTPLKYYNTYTVNCQLSTDTPRPRRSPRAAIPRPNPPQTRLSGDRNRAAVQRRRLVGHRHRIPVAHQAEHPPLMKSAKKYVPARPGCPRHDTRSPVMDWLPSRVFIDGSIPGQRQVSLEEMPPPDSASHSFPPALSVRKLISSSAFCPHPQSQVARLRSKLMRHGLRRP